MLLSCMQDDLLIDYDVDKTVHEMWKALQEKYGGISATKFRELVMKFGKDATEPYNETTSQGDEKNDKRA